MITDMFPASRGLSRREINERRETSAGPRGVPFRAGASVPLTTNDVLVTWDPTRQTVYSNYSTADNKF